MSDGESWCVDSEETMNNFINFVRDKWRQGITYSIQRQTRTIKQNAAIHACLRRLAIKLNDAGYGVPHPLNSAKEIPYSEANCKELLLKPFMVAMFGKESTKSLTTQEVGQVMSTMLNRVAECTGVVEEFILGELSDG